MHTYPTTFPPPPSHTHSTYLYLPSLLFAKSIMVIDSLWILGEERKLGEREKGEKEEGEEGEGEGEGEEEGKGQGLAYVLQQLVGATWYVVHISVY